MYKKEENDVRRIQLSGAYLVGRYDGAGALVGGDKDRASTVKRTPSDLRLLDQARRSGP